MYQYSNISQKIESTSIYESLNNIYLLFGGILNNYYTED